MKITVPATSANLGPGFDTLGLAIDLKNEIIIKSSKFHTVDVKGEGSKNPILRKNSMFFSIFNDFYNKIRQSKKRNFSFEFINRIPPSRGLGSSSAIIVAAIQAAYSIEQIDISKDKILNLSALYEKHPDNITSAVMGGFNVSAMKDGKVVHINRAICKDVCCVVVIPSKPISTVKSRKALPFKYSKKDTIFNISHSSLLTAAFMSENWEMLRVSSLDKIHQSYRMRDMPELFSIQQFCLDSGALMSTLSGSGSTIFNMVYSIDSKKFKQSLKMRFSNFTIEICSFDNDGLKISI